MKVVDGMNVPESTEEAFAYAVDVKRKILALDRNKDGLKIMMLGLELMNLSNAYGIDLDKVNEAARQA